MTILETKQKHFCDPGDHEEYHRQNMIDKFHEITDVPREKIKETKEKHDLGTRLEDYSKLFKHIAQDLNTTYMVRTDPSARTRLIIKEVNNQ